MLVNELKSESGVGFHPLVSTEGEEGDEERCYAGLGAVGHGGADGPNLFSRDVDRMFCILGGCFIASSS